MSEDNERWLVALPQRCKGLSLIPTILPIALNAPPPRVSTFHCNYELHEATCENGFVFSWTFHCFLKKRKKKLILLVLCYCLDSIVSVFLSFRWPHSGHFRVCHFVIRPAFHPLLTFFYLRYHTIRWSSSRHGHTELGFCAKVTQTCIYSAFILWFSFLLVVLSICCIYMSLFVGIFIVR